jgi:4-hydroxy-tetrahydrodipicolinate reductase
VTKPARALLFGLGAIGIGIGRVAAERRDIEIVGAVDSAPGVAGRPVYDALGLIAAGRSNPPIFADAASALAETQADVVLHATGSYLPDVLPQLVDCARSGANVVSTCEELSYPWVRHPELAKQLDAEAKAHGATILGTGVNPGFVMDTLVVALSGVCRDVRHVRLARIVDVSKRREQLQRKVGVGLSETDFHEKAATGRFGHVGLKESCWMLAEGLGWRLDTLDETLDPVLGPSGDGIGMHQTATGTVNGRTVIEAVVQMSTGADQPRDEIEIDATPPVHMTIDGGIMGDTATAAIIVNAVPRVIAQGPGLVTMLDLPLLSGRGVVQ